MKINNFRGELSDNSAKKEALVLTITGTHLRGASTQDADERFFEDFDEGVGMDVGLQ